MEILRQVALPLLGAVALVWLVVFDFMIEREAMQDLMPVYYVRLDGGLK